MPIKTSIQIDNENFNHFFAKESALMSEKQREELPRDLYFKIFKRGGSYDTTSTNKLSFLAKIFILIKALRKRVLILVEDPNGMDEEVYFKYKKMLAKREYSISAASDLIEDTVFVLAAKEVMDTYSQMNMLSASPAYSYLIKAKNATPNKVEEYKKSMEYLCKFLTNYEGNRKRIAMNFGLNMSEWLILIAMYHGKEIVGSSLYNEIYRYSFNSSKTKIKQAFGTLENRGYIQKFGVSRGMKMQITPLGKDKLNSVFQKNILFC